MSFLLDTNVLSELRKVERAHPRVREWADGVPFGQIYTSVIVIGEIRRGIELKRRRNPAEAEMLDRWLMTTRAKLGERILAVDDRIAEVWAMLNVPRTLPVLDGLLAATAIVHQMTLVTRNVRDMRGAGLVVFNPFDA